MDTIARTTRGPVEGRVKEGVLLFTGIPYAEPPVGDLRFAPPQPHAGWSGTLSAQRFGNAAPQPGGRGLTSSPPRRMGEDCLTLNVTTPALDDAGRPVLVWIHGGGFRTGQGAIPWYNGASFAKRGDIVTVSLNYRLGAFGFLNLADLGDPSGELADSGITGILDQIAALEWVRENIRGFGGDPDRVTVAGESAGAMSVGVLLGCPAARGLFRRAIAQSGAAHHVLGARTARAISEALREDLAAHDLEALRALPTQALLDAQVRLEARLAESPQLGDADVTGAGGMPFQPSVGGPSLPQPPYPAVRAGASADVALLVGTNAHEATLWHQADPDPAKLERIAGRYLPDPARALDAYRRDHPGASAFDLLIALTTDYMFRIPALRLAEAHTANGGRTFNYLFSWRSRAFGGRLGATHALEIPFTFNNLERMGVDVFLGEGPAPRDLASAMHACWIAFVRDGDPNLADAPRTLPAWPRFDAQRRPLMEFGDEIALREDPFPETRPLWEGVR
jgi:para-nitrobenzyl esterase